MNLVNRVILVELVNLVIVLDLVIMLDLVILVKLLILVNLMIKFCEAEFAIYICKFKEGQHRWRIMILIIGSA